MRRPLATDDPAMLGLIPLGPGRELQVIALEIIGAAGFGIDLRGHDVDVFQRANSIEAMQTCPNAKRVVG